MKIHRRLIALVGLGMLLVLSITVLSLQSITAVFSQTTKSVSTVSLKVQRLWKVEKDLAGMSMHVHDFIATGGDAERAAYEASRAAVRGTLDELAGMDLDKRDRAILESILDDFAALGKKASRIFSLSDPGGTQHMIAHNLMLEMDGLVEWLGKDIDKYKERSAEEMDELDSRLHGTKVRINLVFAIILLTSISFLFAFGVYIYRKVSVPLGELWEGAEAVSRGDLDYRMRSHGEGDIVKLGERFNEMTQKLKQSYADLEQRLLDRTKELAALNSVSLALGQAGTLAEVLQKSLQKVLDSLSSMEPRGGVFLCDPDGKQLHLVAHKGLSPAFAEREKTIHMGECLCGSVAQSGELLFTEQGCKDPRHTLPGSAAAHAHVIIPIKARGIVLGVVFLYPTKDFNLKPSDVQMLDTIGAQLGMAVENLRLYGEVKESSEKYWSLFENSRDLLFTMDTEGRFTAVNKATEKFLGYSDIELTGKSVTDFLMKEGIETVKRTLEGERMQGRQPREFEVKKRDGGRAIVEVSVRKLEQKRAPGGFQVSARDVTEQKTLRELLVGAERLAAIGQVGIAVRHEINNPLTTVIGNAEILIERYEGKDDELTDRLRMVLDNALRIAEIVKRIYEIKHEKTVDYLRGVKMTDLKQG